MIPKRRPRTKMNVRPSERVRSPSHLAWVRGFYCLVRETHPHPAPLTCDGRMEAHHVRVDGDGTTGRKPGDDKVVCLCTVHHEEGHRIGWKSFEAKYRVDLTAIAAELWKASPHRIKWERKQMEAMNV